VPLSAEWRTTHDSDTILIVRDEETVVTALTADPMTLSTLLTETGDLNGWRGDHPVTADKRSPDSWGDLVIARAATGEVITMDPERYWEGIYTWFRSRGVDYDTWRR
jgi:hypothetical protein